MAETVIVVTMSLVVLFAAVTKFKVFDPLAGFPTAVLSADQLMLSVPAAVVKLKLINSPAQDVMSPGTGENTG